MRCLEIGYIPIKWRDVQVVFIPQYTAKNFRPISLSSFLMKTMERHIREQLNKLNLCCAQHAYLKGKSVETALHDVVSVIERNIYYREFTLGVH